MRDAENTNRETPPLSALESGSIRLEDLHVEPDEPGDFDVAACKRLLAVLVAEGSVTCADASGQLVSLDTFFRGNRSRYSIAANHDHLVAPLDTSSGWLEFLRGVESHDAVDCVRVEICMIEPYEGRRIGMWPYSDAVAIDASLDVDRLAQLVAALDPDEVRELSWREVDEHRSAPPGIGMKRFRVWWN